MLKVEEIFENLDYKLLRRQRNALNEVIQKKVLSQFQLEGLQGLQNLLDAIQDTEEEINGKRRDTTTSN